MLLSSVLPMLLWTAASTVSAAGLRRQTRDQNVTNSTTSSSSSDATSNSSTTLPYCNTHPTGSATYPLPTGDCILPTAADTPVASFNPPSYPPLPSSTSTSSEDSSSASTPTPAPTPLSSTSHSQTPTTMEDSVEAIEQALQSALGSAPIVV